MNTLFKDSCQSAVMSNNIQASSDSKIRIHDKGIKEDAQEGSMMKSSETQTFCILSLLIFLLVIANFILASMTLKTLRIGYGMESIELNSLQNIIKFFGNADLDTVYQADGKLSGFKDVPVEISGMDSSVWIDLLEHLNNKISVQNLVVDKKGTHMKNISDFEVVDPASGNIIFSTGFPNFDLPHGVSKIDVDIVHARRVASPINTTLYLRSETVTRLKGNEGTRMNGKNIMWTADGDIFIKSVNGSIILSGDEGVVIDLRSLNLVNDIKNNKSINTHYKLCVCMPEGKVFKIPVAQRHNVYLACHNVDKSFGRNPCQ